MYSVNQVADYIIFRLTADESVGIENLKLQKLLYYTQAWYLAFCGKPQFDGKFQAWIHGPVNRELYDRFRDKKWLYSPVKMEDIADLESTLDSLSDHAKEHIDNVLSVYAPFSGNELEEMTHREDPWILARKGYSPTQRCEEEIDEIIMRDYYKKRLVDEA